MASVLSQRRAGKRRWPWAGLALLCFLLGIVFIPVAFLGPTLFWPAALICLVIGSAARTVRSCSDCGAPLALPLPATCPVCDAVLET